MTAGNLQPEKPGKPRLSYLTNAELELRQLVSEHSDATLAELCEFFADRTGNWVGRSAVSPKSYNSVAAGVILIGLITYSDTLLAQSPQFIQGIGAFSPFYHYGQLALWASGAVGDPHLWLHLLWLLWTGVTFWFITIWAYQRDSVVQ